TIYEVTNVVTNTLTVGVSSPIESTSDRNYAIGYKVDLRITAGTIGDLNTAVTPDFTGGIAAAGTTQAAATQLIAPAFYGSKCYRVVSTATTGSATGVALPTAVTGTAITVINIAAVPIQVYSVNGGGA